MLVFAEESTFAYRENAPCITSLRGLNALQFMYSGYVPVKITGLSGASLTEKL